MIVAGGVSVGKAARICSAAESLERLEFQEQLYRRIAATPKAELHLHLEATCSVDTIWRLMQKNGVQAPGVESREDVLARFQVRTLDDFLSLFVNVIQPSFRSVDDFEFMVRDCRDYLKRNNIVHAEVFFSPTRFLQNGLSFDGIVAVLDEQSRQAAAEGVTLRYLIDVSRSYGLANAERNLDLTLAHRADSIIGIGLGGAEKGNLASNFASVFARARSHGLRTVAHAGEDLGPESIYDAIQTGAERIGHGISAHLDDSLMDHMAERRIPIEVCPSSNVFTGTYAPHLSMHPARKFFDRGLLVTVNTDDPLIFGIELIDEYLNLFNHLDFSEGDLHELIRNGFRAAFLDETTRQRHLNAVDQALAAPC